MKKILFIMPLMAISLIGCNKGGGDKPESTYTITFKNEGDEDKKIENIKAGSIFTDVPTPSAREGYTFIGWCTDNESKNVFDFSSIKIYQDYTFYSGWEKDVPAVYTVSFNGYNCKAKGGDVTDLSPAFQVTITADDDDLVLNLAANTGFTLPEENELTVLFDNEPGTPKLDYKYEKSNKKLTIIKKANTSISVSAISNTELCYVKFDAGEGNVIEGTNERYKYYETKKGKTWSTLGVDRGIGAKQNGKDFAYWMLEGTNQYVGETYAINGNITVVPKFVDINTGKFAISARTDEVKFIGTDILDSLSKPIKYTIDNGAEETLEKDEEIDLNAGQTCYFESENVTICASASGSQILNEKTDQTGYYHVSGNIKSFITGAMQCPEHAFDSFFYEFSNLVSAEHLILLNDTNAYCYRYMFSKCSSLIVSPIVLPAMVLHNDCYSNMFSDCYSLIKPPILPALTLADDCYGEMFGSCTSLVVAPELPATTLALACYSGMFRYCYSLISAPMLPATELTEMCYISMFDHCTSLISVSYLPGDITAKGCYVKMFASCTSLKVSDESGILFYNCSDDRNKTDYMFSDTGGTFKGTPETGKAYYWYI